MWSAEEKKAAAELFESSGYYSQSMLQDDIAHQELYNLKGLCQDLSEADRKKFHKDLRDSLGLQTAMDSLFPTGDLHNHTSSIHLPPMNSDYIHKIRKKARDIRCVKPAEVYDRLQQSSKPTQQGNLLQHDGSDLTPLEEVEAYLDSLTLGKEQQTLLHHIKQYLHQLGPSNCRTADPPSPPNYLVTGMPGTGKSFVIDQINILSDMFESGHVANMAYNGIAAVNISGGTLCSLLSISSDGEMKDLTPEAIMDLRKDLHIESLCLVIIDEVSNIDATTMSIIDKRFRQLTGKYDQKFGGLGIIFFGDFSQLPPVRGNSMTHTVLQLTTIPHEVVPPSDSHEPFSTLPPAPQPSAARRVYKRAKIVKPSDVR